MFTLLLCAVRAVYGVLIALTTSLADAADARPPLIV